METKTSKGKEIKIPGPDHPITISPAEGKVRVTVAGRIVAESAQALRLDEKGYPTVYYLPRSIGLAVCGDALYNDVHLHLGESNAEGRNEWIAALDTIESLKPVAAIAGHKRPGAPDTPDNIEATRKYIRDFDRIASHTKIAVELYEQMLTLYPERINPAVLWNSSIATKPVG